MKENIEEKILKRMVNREIENITDEALLQEIYFNYGKVFSELKLYHLAEKHFRLALALADEHRGLLGEIYWGERGGLGYDYCNNDDNGDNDNDEE